MVYEGKSPGSSGVVQLPLGMGQFRVLAYDDRAPRGILIDEVTDDATLCFGVLRIVDCGWLPLAVEQSWRRAVMGK